MKIKLKRNFGEEAATAYFSNDYIDKEKDREEHGKI